MNDIVIARCKDQEHIITQFIQFYVDMGFDRICVVDNGSRDNTVNLILQHVHVDKVLLISDALPNPQCRLREYYEMFAVHASRWVFMLNVDEFVWLPGGIKRFAASIPQETTILRLPVVRMMPEGGESGQRNMLLRTRRCSRAFGNADRFAWRKMPITNIEVDMRVLGLAPYVEHQDKSVFVRHYGIWSEPPVVAASDGSDRISCATAEPPHSVAESPVPARPDAGPDQDGGCFDNREVDWVEDRTIADWYLYCVGSAGPGKISPIVCVPRNGRPWQAYCVRETRRCGDTGDEHLVLLFGMEAPNGHAGRGWRGRQDDVLLRIHSECILGDVFGSDLCDCSHQLRQACQEMEEAGCGVIIYLRQEGRGVGLFNKFKTMRVEDDDTFRRNERLGLPADCRDYRIAGRILQMMGIQSVRLISGNPYKISCLESMGIQVRSRCRVSMGRLSVEAQRECLAKLSRGYRYQLDYTDGPPEADSR